MTSELKEKSMCEVKKRKHLQENDEEIENVREAGNEIKLYGFNDQTSLSPVASSFW